jgi:hypothetical protein
MSTIIATTLSNGSVSVPTNTVVNGSAKAWVSLNGTGTIALRESFNISSIADAGTGDYRATLTTAMVDTNQVVCGCVGSQYPYIYYLVTAATLGITSVDSSGTFADSGIVQALTMGDLA